KRRPRGVPWWRPPLAFAAQRGGCGQRQGAAGATALVARQLLAAVGTQVHAVRTRAAAQQAAQWQQPVQPQRPGSLAMGRVHVPTVPASLDGSGKSRLASIARSRSTLDDRRVRSVAYPSSLSTQEACMISSHDNQAAPSTWPTLAGTALRVAFGVIWAV